MGLSAAVLSVVLFTAWFTTKMILRPFEPGSSGPGEVHNPMSTRIKVFRVDRRHPRPRGDHRRDHRLGRAQRRVPAARRSSASSTGSGSTSAAFDLHQPRGALPDDRGDPHDRRDDLHRQPHGRRGRTACRPRSRRSTCSCATTSRAGNMDDADGAEVVPVRRDALPLHLVLEPHRLHPAADERPRDVRRLRPRGPVVRALRRDGEHLGPARADAHGVVRLPRRGHPGPGRPQVPRELDPGRDAGRDEADPVRHRGRSRTSSGSSRSASDSSRTSSPATC